MMNLLPNTDEADRKKKVCVTGRYAGWRNRC